MLNLACKAAFFAASQSTLFCTVVPSIPGVAEVTVPYVSTNILTTTFPDTFCAYSGKGNFPMTVRPPIVL